MWRMITRRQWQSAQVSKIADHVLEIFLPIEASIEQNMMLQSPSRIEELVDIFIHATKVSRDWLDTENVTDFLVDGDWILDMGTGQK